MSVDGGTEGDGLTTSSSSLAAGRSSEGIRRPSEPAAIADRWSLEAARLKASRSLGTLVACLR
jgi:hypothetical protein